MTQWEYKLYTARFNQGQAQTLADLNELGAQGWELIKIDEPYNFWFKRIKT